VHPVARPAIVLLLALALAFGLSWRAAGVGAEATGPTLLRYPYLQQVTQSGALIIWTTDKGGTSEVRYSTDGPPLSTAPATSDLFVEPEIEGETSLRYYVHVAQVAGLAPGTTYAYTVVAYDPTGNPSPPSEPATVTTFT